MTVSSRHAVDHGKYQYDERYLCVVCIVRKIMTAYTSTHYQRCVLLISTCMHLSKETEMQSDNKMATAYLLVIVLCLEFSAGCTYKCHQPAQLPTLSKSEPQEADIHGVWLATVYGLDWPSSSILSTQTNQFRIQKQKKALTDKLDNLVRIGINTVFFRLNLTEQHFIAQTFYRGQRC